MIAVGEFIILNLLEGIDVAALLGWVLRYPFQNWMLLNPGGYVPDRRHRTPPENVLSVPGPAY